MYLTCTHPGLSGGCSKIGVENATGGNKFYSGGCNKLIYHEVVEATFMGNSYNIALIEYKPCFHALNPGNIDWFQYIWDKPYLTADTQ